MKYVLLSLSLIFVMSSHSIAATKCKKNYLGEYVCTGSGNYYTKTKRNYLGYDVTKSRNGKVLQSCKTNYLGQYVCK